MILLMCLPQLVLALATTIDRKNVKILVQHPSLVLLPVFSFFTFSKKKVNLCCKGPQDSRVHFSYFYTLINIIVTSICYGLDVFLYLFNYYGSFGYGFKVNFIVISATIFGLGILFTLLFLYIEKVPQCDKEMVLIHLYDPDS